MKKIKSHTFRKKRYKIIISEIDNEILKLEPRCKGLCDAPNTSGKSITLSPKLSGLNLIKVSIDEGIHACCWDLDNTTVDEMSESIAKFLYRLGVRDITNENI